MSELRDRIAAAIESVRIQRDGDAAFMADAVIRELPELTQPVSVEPIGDYQYVCHPCGSSFSFYSSSTMQQFALIHSRSHSSSEKLHD